MGSKRGPVGLLVLAAAFLVFAFGASPAKAAFGIEEWEALTCDENEDTPPLGGTLGPAPPPIPKAAGQCTASTPEKWFTQATGHPPFGITDFTLNNEGGFPEGFVKEIVVDTPEGLGVNPEATDQCPLEQAETALTTCPADSIVGLNYPDGGRQRNAGLSSACDGTRSTTSCPFDGVPSMVGFPDSTGEPTFS